VKLRNLALILAAAAPLAVHADDWKGKGQAGLLISQGNTDAKSANAALELTRALDGWKHAFTAAALYGKSGAIKSAERWSAGWQSDRDITPRLFGFGALRYGQDKFSGFQYQGTVSAGLGYKLIDSEPTQLTGRGGVGYRKFRPELITKNAAGAVTGRTRLDSVGDAVLTAGLDYDHAFTATTSLTNRFLVEAGSGNTLFADNLALAVKMSDKLALSLGLSVQHNTKPPAGLKHRDVIETVNLVYAF
jgi:putative salt-induced outer membrane protein